MTTTRIGDRPRTALLLAAIASGIALLGGCQVNPFLAGYTGERLEPVKAATVVQEPPAAGTARELGVGQFTASTGDAEVAEQATEAACAVGADLVLWKVSPMTREEWVESDPVYERRASGRGQFASYIPLPGSREHWECKATFWRSFSADQAPAPSPGSTPSATPGSRPASGS